MYAWFYSGSALVALPQIGMVLFIGVFVMVCVRVFFGSRASTFDSIAAMPLRDENTVLHTAPTGDRHGH